MKSSDKKKSEGFIRWNYSIFVDSLKKIDFHIIWIILLDMLFYLASGYLIIWWFQRISAKIQSFELPSDIDLVSEKAAEQLGNQIAELNFILRLSSVFLLLAIIFIASIIKGIIWAKTTKTRFSFNLLSKFLILNLIWMGFWSFVMYLIFKFVRPELVSVFLLIALFVASYLTYTLYAFFMQTGKIKYSLASIKINFSMINYFLLPFGLMAAMWLLLVVLISLLRLDAVIFTFVARLYGMAGLGFSGSIGTGLPSVEFIVIVVVSLLANPFIRAATYFSRHYLSTLISELQKK